MAYRSAVPWSPPVAPAPRAATWIHRLRVALAGSLFALVVRYVLIHDPGPGLSGRGWLTIALAAVVLVALRAHRRPLRSRAPQVRATAECATALALGILLATAPATTPAKVAAPATDEPPVLVGVVAGARGWLAELKRQVDQGTTPPPTTTRRPR